VHDLNRGYDLKGTILFHLMCADPLAMGREKRLPPPDLAKDSAFPSIQKLQDRIREAAFVFRYLHGVYRLGLQEFDQLPCFIGVHALEGLHLISKIKMGIATE
jgi:hypothetical protein